MGIFDRLRRRAPVAPPVETYPHQPVDWAARRAAEARDSNPLPDGLTPLCDTLSALGTSTTVSQAQAISIVAYWACSRAISETIGTLPRELIEKTKDGGVIQRNDHYVWELIAQEPNDYQSAPVFWEALLFQASQGNGYAAIERKGDVPVALHLMHGPNVEVIVRNGVKLYRYWTSKGVMEFFDADVLHIHGPSPDGLKGYSFLYTHNRTLARTNAMDAFSAKFFERGATYGGVLSIPGKLSPEGKKNLRESWEEFHSGIDNAFKLFLADNGSKLEAIGVDAEKAQLNESRDAQVIEICSLMRVPPHKIGRLKDSKYANIEQQNIDWVTDTLLPWCVKIEAEADRKLLFPSERKSLQMRHDMEALLRGDMAAQTARFESGMRWGYLTLNDVRRKLGLPPVQGGDTPLVPMNMQTLAQAIAGGSKQEADKAPAA